LKPIPSLIASASLVSSSLFADTAILVALPSELDGVRKEVRLVGQPVELAERNVSIGYRKGEKVYIVRTGAGTINAAMTTQAVLTRYKVERVISIGVAGWIGEEARGKSEEGRAMGDIFIATEVINHQQGKETPGGFEVKKETEVRSQNPEAYRQKCEELRKLATEVATNAHQSNTNLRAFASLREGRLVSGDSFIASSAKRKWLRETFKADAVDMVSAGIARVCEANGVPYVILRVLSDNADESASQDFAAFIQSSKEPITIPITIGLIDRLVPDQKH
jgi:adenosylhomocysteine nucleosidase